ncbi:hypothetical protein LOTGIDRAFT_229548 [Lottia gigantea]|uniref:SUEL-type lectin domain-containing protein n=1 Tax=Lottia gigantea TaxID=225164 RepID=V4B675_LOTGI|nr:hypothetical protein LOTGIDRAFT_229548 [Lottia gigantea]ESO83999.1 hypothetical protein LOTGIDRAFT_229548 [Lottia gigantea]
MCTNFLWMCLCCLVCFVLQTDGRIDSTACYGVSGLSCSTHALSCVSPLVIQIMNTTYGFRPSCFDLSGKSHCQVDQCCREEPYDCFTLFSENDSLKVQEKCNGHQSCIIQGRRQLDVVCRGHVISAYSKVQYNCVFNDSSPTLFTDTPDVLNPTNIKTSFDPVMVAVISVITVLVIMILVAIFICKIRHKQSKSQEDNNTALPKRESYTPHYTTIDDTSVRDRNSISEYEDVELDDQYSTSTLVDNFDNNKDTPRIRIYNSDKYSFVTPANYNHVHLSSNDLTDRNNYDHINDVRFPVGEVDDYNHILDPDKQEMAFDDNYNHISAHGKR